MHTATIDELEFALAGLVHKAAGHKKWKAVENLDPHQRTHALIESATSEIAEASVDTEADPRKLTYLMKQLRAYQHILFLENFIYNEVDWEEKNTPELIEA